MGQAVIDLKDRVILGAPEIREILYAVSAHGGLLLTGPLGFALTHEEVAELMAAVEVAYAETTPEWIELHNLKRNSRYRRENAAPANPKLQPDERRAFIGQWIHVHGATCVYCGRHGDGTHDADGRAWHVDRIVPGIKGGRYEHGNMALACATCNLSKGAKLITPQ